MNIIKKEKSPTVEYIECNLCHSTFAWTNSITSQWITISKYVECPFCSNKAKSIGEI